MKERYKVFLTIVTGMGWTFDVVQKMLNGLLNDSLITPAEWIILSRYNYLMNNQYNNLFKMENINYILTEVFPNE